MTTVDTAAKAIREAILSGEVGDDEFLGSEGDLLERLGVSRPTLRQAGRLLEAEQLVTIKRGPGGGWFAKGPTEQGVVHAATVVLRSRATTVLDLLDVEALVGTEVARRAARLPDARVRASAHTVVDELTRAAAGSDGVRRFAALRTSFPRHVATIAGSPTLELLERVLLDLADTAVHQPIYLDEENVRDTLSCYRRAAEAIADGRERAVVAALRSHQHKIAEWLAGHDSDRGLAFDLVPQQAAGLASALGVRPTARARSPHAARGNAAGSRP